MQSLKLIIASSLLMFISTGVFASNHREAPIDAPIDSLQESSKISAAKAISLFSFISVEKESSDSTTVIEEDNSSSLRIIDLIQTYF